jgi:hypothetical protein
MPSLAPGGEVQDLQDGPTRKATFDGEHPAPRLAHLEDLREFERRPGSAQPVDQVLAPPDISSAAAAMQDSKDPVVPQRVHPGLAAVAQQVVGGDPELGQDDPKAVILGHSHTDSLNDSRLSAAHAVITRSSQELRNSSPRAADGSLSLSDNDTNASCPISIRTHRFPRIVAKKRWEWRFPTSR